MNACLQCLYRYTADHNKCEVSWYELCPTQNICGCFKAGCVTAHPQLPNFRNGGSTLFRKQNVKISTTLIFAKCGQKIVSLLCHWSIRIYNGDCFFSVRDRLHGSIFQPSVGKRCNDRGSWSGLWTEGHIAFWDEKYLGSNLSVPFASRVTLTKLSFLWACFLICQMGITLLPSIGLLWNNIHQSPWHIATYSRHSINVSYFFLLSKGLNWLESRIFNSLSQFSQKSHLGLKLNLGLSCKAVKYL